MIKTSFCFCRMTSCRNLFHNVLLSSLSLFLSHSFPICMSSKLHQATHFFHNFPTFSFLVFLFCYCFFTNVFPLIFSPVRRFAALKTRTFSECFVSSDLSPSSLAVCYTVFVSISLLPFVISLTVLSLSFSVFFSSSLSALCHSPLSPFHKSICWPTGCVTDSVL